MSLPAVSRPCATEPKTRVRRLLVAALLALEQTHFRQLAQLARDGAGRQAYTDAVAHLGRYFACSPRQLSSQQVQDYLLHLLAYRHMGNDVVHQARRRLCHAPARHGPFECKATTSPTRGRTVFVRAAMVDAPGTAVAFGQTTFRLIGKKI